MVGGMLMNINIFKTMTNLGLARVCDGTIIRRRFVAAMGGFSSYFFLLSHF